MSPQPLKGPSMSEQKPSDAAIKFAIEYWFGPLAIRGDESDPRVINLATAYDRAFAAEREKSKQLLEACKAALEHNVDTPGHVLAQLRAALTPLTTKG